MATYKQLQAKVRVLGGGSVRPCWIAHVKADYGLTRGQAPNRHDPSSRVYPCPPEKRVYIARALADAGLITV